MVPLMGAGGAARAGCMGFSLVGLLVSVGLVVWMGSQAFDGATRPVRGGTGNTDAAASTVTESTVLAVAAVPDTGLTGEDSIEVSSAGLEPGEKVTVTACTRSPGPGSAAPACDPTSETSTTASAAGRIEVRFAMPRVVSASGLPIDCATDAGRCEVQVRGSDSGSVGRVPVTFADGLDQPDLLDQLGD